MDTAEFSYSRWNAIVMSMASVVVLLFPAAIVTAAAYLLIQYASSSVPVDPKHLHYGLIGILLGLWMATALWQRIRYRHAIRERYVLDSNGILVESAHFRAFVPWQEVRSAEYLHLFFLLRLRSDRIDAPVVIFEGGGPDGKGRYSDRWQLARSLVESNLRERFSKRWLP
jgi:hypothetical protein